MEKRRCILTTTEHWNQLHERARTYVCAYAYPNFRVEIMWCTVLILVSVFFFAFVYLLNICIAAHLLCICVPSSPIEISCCFPLFFVSSLHKSRFLFVLIASSRLCRLVLSMSVSFSLWKPLLMRSFFSNVIEFQFRFFFAANLFHLFRFSALHLLLLHNLSIQNTQ